MGIYARIAVTMMVMVLSSAMWSSSVSAQQLLPQSLPASSPLLSNRGSGESDVIPISSGMFRDLLPTIPNLQMGFQYFFGNNINTSQANADYLLPYKLGGNSVLFGEAHGNYWNFGQQRTNGANNRVDISIGGGYRQILNRDLLIGVNGFYDTSRLYNTWYPSGGVGVELAANIGTTDAVDINANWYGNIFSANDILNAFRNHGGSFDVEAGYSHALFNSQYDLRLKLTGYKFDTGFDVYGYKTGADLTTRNGMFTMRYEYGYDRINGSWNNIGGFVNMGFQIENIIKGESPVTAPEPIFKSPRNLARMFTQKVKRDWNQPSSSRVTARSISTSTSVCTLDEYQFINTRIVNSTWYQTTPQTPVQDFYQYTVRIKWCGLDLERTGSDFTLYGLYVTSVANKAAYTQEKNFPAFRTESGYIDVYLDSTTPVWEGFHFPSQSFLFPNRVPPLDPLPTLYFKPGGGISFSFIP